MYVSTIGGLAPNRIKAHDTTSSSTTSFSSSCFVSLHSHTLCLFVVTHFNSSHHPLIDPSSSSSSVDTRSLISSRLISPRSPHFDTTSTTSTTTTTTTTTHCQSSAILSPSTLPRQTNHHCRSVTPSPTDLHRSPSSHRHTTYLSICPHPTNSELSSILSIEFP